MYKTLLLHCQGPVYTITLNRPEQRNSLNSLLIQELLAVLNQAEQDPVNRVVILRGQANFFCTGMDFKEAVNAVEGKNPEIESSAYMQLLHRLASSSRVTIACVESVAMAGGVGLVAASDLVIATSNSQFVLSEALWGLLPCCVTPYLIRRIGFQAAYRLTITTQPITAEEAYRIQLIDILTALPDEEIHKQCLRLSRLDPQTLHELKSYFRKMWLITEEMETTAINEITRLMQTAKVQRNITNYLQHGKFPWENTTEVSA